MSIVFKIILVLLVCIECVYSDDFFVSKDGLDTNSGTLDKPYKTIEKARDTIKKIKIKNPNGVSKNGFRVYIRGGDYTINRSILFGATDSGTQQFPISYQAYNNENVRLTGGLDVNLDSFANGNVGVSYTHQSNIDINKIKSVSLKQIGISTISKFDWLRPVNKSTINEPISPEEVYLNSEPMTLARWPNEGWAKTGDIVNDGATYFVLKDARIKNWDLNTQLFGFWYWDWYDEAIKAKSINVAKNIIQLERPPYYGLKKDKRFFAFNTLSELDFKNEYYIDRSAGVLYLIPNSEDVNQKVTISIIKEPIIKINGASNLNLNGLLVENTRDSGIFIGNSSNINISNVKVRNTGTSGVEISGGKNVNLYSSEIYNTGTRGIYVDGGDRKLLVPSNHTITNTYIHNFGRRIYSKSAGIEVQGVGQVIYKNRIENSPHTGIYFSGNDHEIRENIIKNVCNNTSDSGAIYTGRDWSGRGTVISKNFINDIVGIPGKDEADVTGVYLDDFASGIEISNNIFSSVYRGIIIGGGRDNKVLQNLMFKTKNSISIDDRGFTWARGSLVKGSELMNALQSVPYQSAVWKKKYPELSVILSDEPALPKGNAIYENYFYLSSDIKKVILSMMSIDEKNNVSTDINPGFNDPEKNDFSIGVSNENAILRNLPANKY